MKLYRLKIQPTSPWRTPWQADTLTGWLCWMCARTQGSDVLHQRILKPALEKQPRFVLSDAFPGDLLPVPDFLRLRKWPDATHKEVKRARWLSSDAFRRVQQGHRLAFRELLPDDVFFRLAQVHNTLSRFTNTTGLEEGSLFVLEETMLNQRSKALSQPEYLSIYLRVETGFESDLLELFHEAAQVGFGADVSVGKGQFEVVSALEPMDWLDETPAGATGVVVLSTFQPGEDDPTDGFGETFTKYGKIGPDFGMENVFKRPLVMFRPGAYFHTPTFRPFVGRAITMDHLLSSTDCQQLRQTGVALAHLAYGLTLPVKFDLVHTQPESETEQAPVEPAQTDLDLESDRGKNTSRAIIV